MLQIGLQSSIPIIFCRPEGVRFVKAVCAWMGESRRRGAETIAQVAGDFEKAGAEDKSIGSSSMAGGGGPRRIACCRLRPLFNPAW